MRRDVNRHREPADLVLEQDRAVHKSAVLLNPIQDSLDLHPAVRLREVVCVVTTILSKTTRDASSTQGEGRRCSRWFRARRRQGAAQNAAPAGFGLDTSSARNHGASIAGPLPSGPLAKSCHPQILRRRRINNGTVGVVYGSNNTQTYNTCGGTNCTPENTSSSGSSWSAFTPGQYVYSSINTVGGGTVGSGSQYCNMSGFQFSEDHSVTIHAVSCQPQWYRVGNPLVTVHLPATTVYVNVAPNMWDTMVGANGDGPAVQAANDWTGQLSGTGVSIEIVDWDCGTGGDCINMQTTTDPMSGCARFDRGATNFSTGFLESSSTIAFPAATWSGESSSRLRRSVAHELAHALGLNDNANCSTANSIMATATS